jgi:aspartate-semialdehyde dehydrogenase
MTITKKTEFTVAVVGATGLVGQAFLNILDERKFPIKSLKVFASKKNAGSKITFQSKNYILEELSDGCFVGCDVAFFSAGGSVSEQWAPKAVSEKCFVIDNSSAFRMKETVALVVPEVNAHKIPTNDLKNCAIIANPNCSTIQLVVILKPLDDAFGLNQVIVSTYQSVSGAGTEGISELKSRTQALLAQGSPSAPSVFAHPIEFNNLPQIDVFDESGFTKEEKKIIFESQKILDLPSLNISATAVRTPTINGHSEAVWVDLKVDVSRDEIMACLKKAEGVVVMDDPTQFVYPTNQVLSGRDEVFVGRIRQDLMNPRRWLMWIVSDNVRKGAALNGVQIAEKLFDL